MDLSQLVTSSPLKAVGVVSFSGTTAAAIRWVSKDGIGALGRLFIGGRFGNLLDDDPKQWRIYADFIGIAERKSRGGSSKKEEVWEVVAQLVGLALGISILI